MRPSLSPGSFAVLGCGPHPAPKRLTLTPSLRHLGDDLRHFHAKHACGYAPASERPSETLTNNPESKTLKCNRHPKQATPKPLNKQKRSETPPPQGRPHIPDRSRTPGRQPARPLNSDATGRQQEPRTGSRAEPENPRIAKHFLC